MAQPMNDQKLSAAMTGKEHKEKCEKRVPPFIIQRDTQVTNRIDKPKNRYGIQNYG